MSTLDELGGQSREALTEKLLAATYESSTMAVFFHAAIADKVGLGPTEEKTVLLLSGRGPLTAGEIGQETGLTSASVTSLIDRLEQKGFVRRARDTQDRRKVIVELDQARLAELMSVFGTLQGVFDGLLDRYSDAQLAAIIDYVMETARRSREAIAQLSGPSQHD